MKQALKDSLRPSQEVLARDLESFLDSQYIAGLDAHGADVIKRLRGFLTGGKLLRGALAMHVYAILSGKASTDVLPLARALELLHAGALIHDDIIDEDGMRRGMPSLHVQYREDALARGLDRPDRYGESQAITVGDVLYFWSFSELSSLSFPQDRVSRVTQMLSMRFVGAAVGQMIDVDLGHGQEDPSVESITRMHLLKTAWYTFVLPLQGAALLAARDDLLADLERLGTALGLIFQLRDDALAYESTSEDIGKPAASDLEEDKKTIQRSLLLTRAQGEQEQWLRDTLGSELSSSDVSRIRELHDTLGVRDEVARIVDTHAATAREIIPSLDVPSALRELLESVLAYNLTRSR